MIDKPINIPKKIKKVIIPKRYKVDLEDKFTDDINDYQKIAKLYVNRISCNLCLDYLHYASLCEKCPFNQCAIISHGLIGCLAYIFHCLQGTKLYFQLNCFSLSFKKYHKNKALEQIKTIIEKSKKLIIWEEI